MKNLKQNFWKIKKKTKINKIFLIVTRNSYTEKLMTRHVSQARELWIEYNDVE